MTFKGIGEHAGDYAGLYIAIRWGSKRGRRRRNWNLIELARLVLRFCPHPETDEHQNH